MKKILTIACICLSFSVSPISLAQMQINLTRSDGKKVPNTIYLPSEQCQGIAIISHGAGGSEKGYSFLAKAMQMRQWLAIVPGHQESGLTVLKQQMRQKGLRAGLATLITDRQAYLGRFMDIQAALSHAQLACAGKPHVLIGHSMGAATTMLAAGAKNHLQLEAPTFKFDAYLALSPQGVGSIFPAHAWQHIEHKTLLMTGTRDTELGGASWKTRLDAYADLPSGCKWSAVIEGASHMSFSGNTNSEQEQALIIKTIWQFIQSDRQAHCPLPPMENGLELEGK